MQNIKPDTETLITLRQTIHSLLNYIDRKIEELQTYEDETIKIKIKMKMKSNKEVTPMDID